MVEGRFGRDTLFVRARNYFVAGCVVVRVPGCSLGVRMVVGKGKGSCWADCCHGCSREQKSGLLAMEKAVVGASSGIDDQFNNYDKFTDHRVQVAQHLGLRIECVDDTRLLVIAVGTIVVVVR